MKPVIGLLGFEVPDLSAVSMVPCSDVEFEVNLNGVHFTPAGMEFQGGHSLKFQPKKF